MEEVDELKAEAEPMRFVLLSMLCFFPLVNRYQWNVSKVFSFQLYDGISCQVENNHTNGRGRAQEVCSSF